jgi:hypothetical protein
MEAAATAFGAGTGEFALGVFGPFAFGCLDF